MSTQLLSRVILGLALALSTFSTTGAQETPAQINELINKAVNLLFFGSEEPISVGHGWRGFFLDPGGIPQLSDTMPLAEYYLELNSLDVTLHVEQGRATPNEGASLATRWKDLVNGIERRPETGHVIDWLEVEADRIDQARTRFYVDSLYFTKYQEYESRFNLLEECKLSGSGIWRLGDLAKYLSLTSAAQSTATDWHLFGWKREMDAEMAIRGFSTTERRRLRRLLQSFEQGHEAANDTVLATWFSPPRGTWRDLDTWVRIDIPEATFEVARIRLIRPWFEIETIYREKLPLDERKIGSSQPISDGERSGVLSFPHGMIGSFIEELVLVRNVRLVDAATHPLNFAHSNSIINRAGYVVRGLPKYP